MQASKRGEFIVFGESSHLVESFSRVQRLWGPSCPGINRLRTDDKYGGDDHGRVHARIVC